MNKYKFINAEKLAEAIKKILQDEISKINLSSEFVETNLTNNWLDEYVDTCIGEANAGMDIMLHDVYRYNPAACYRIDVAYNKYITGVDLRDADFFQIFVGNLDSEVQSAQTVLDLLFLNKWYLDNFAEDLIVKPFVCRLKYLSQSNQSLISKDNNMDIIDFKKGENEGALFLLDLKKYAACTDVESSRYFKTLKGAIGWLSKRGYHEA